MLFFKSFHQVLITQVPCNQIQIFIQSLAKSIIKELLDIRKSSVQNFTLLSLKLEIFTNITNIKGIFGQIGDTIEVCLEQITHKFFAEPLKDREVVDYLMVLLSDHFRYTNKFSSCHGIFIDKYLMLLSESGKHGVIYEELFCLVSRYCYSAASILNQLSQCYPDNSKEFLEKFPEKIIKLAKNTIDFGLLNKKNSHK